MNRNASGLLGAIIAFSCLIPAMAVYAALGTRVPISAETATAMATSAFPLTIDMERGKLFLTEPKVLFKDATTISLQVRLQAYDHRPSQGIALSEKGVAVIAAQPDYDPATQKILLKDPQLISLDFDRDSQVSRDFVTVVRATWAASVTNPIRTEVPPHSYIEPFKPHIYDIIYDGKSIYLELRYQ